MNTENAFFAAYGQPVTLDGERTKPPKSRRAAANSRNGDRNLSTVETQYSDVAWYRVDSRHDDSNGVPPPHVAPRQPLSSKPAGTGRVPVETPPSSSSEVASPAWNPLETWQTSCMVMATPMEIPYARIPESQAASAAPPVVEVPREISPVAAAPETAHAFDREVVQAAPVVETPVTSGPTAETAAITSKVESPASPAIAPAGVPRWMPQWEVDEFAWPEELLRLQDKQQDYFRYAGEKLRDASREGLKTMAVVSTREKEGVTTMAICLARAAAAAGARVALLDANLHHPELGPKLGLEFSNGWQESLENPATLAEAAVVALDSGLTLLPLSASHRIGSLSDPRVSQLITEIAAAFDLVIIDAGVARDGEETWFADVTPRAISAALVVRDLRRTTETETLVTASRLKLFGVEAIGIAENYSPGPGTQTAAA